MMRFLWVLVLLVSIGSAQAQPFGPVVAAYGPGGVPGVTATTGGCVSTPCVLNGGDTFTATGGNTATSIANRAANLSNALDFGADPTGVADSTTAINTALSATQIGVPSSVHLPAGVYHVTNALNVGSATQGQCLVGDGWNTIIDVSSDFNSSALGVVVFNGANPNTTFGSQPCLRDVAFRFHQPTDIATTTTAPSSASATTITVASTAGIVVGDYIVDNTSSAITTVLTSPQSQFVATTVTVIAGNVLTLSQAVIAPGVGNGDAIGVAHPRSTFTTLGAGCNVAQGGNGCKYPPAVYGVGMGLPAISHVLVSGGWDGFYLHGGGSGGTNSLLVSDVYLGVLDVGLDIDNVHNFPQLHDFQLWNFGFNYTGQGGAAFKQVYYDGNLIAANLGATDGIAVTNFQTWIGRLVLNSNWTWGSFLNVELDGGADLEVTTGANGGAVTQFSNLYQTGKPQSAHCVLDFTSAGAVARRFQFSNTQVGNSINTDFVCVSGTFSGILQFDNSYFYSSGAHSSINASTNTGATTIMVSNSEFTGLGAQTLVQVGASDILDLTGNYVLTAGSAAVVTGLTDSAANSITGNAFNGFVLTAPGSLGVYQTAVQTAYYRNTQTFAANGTWTVPAFCAYANTTCFSRGRLIGAGGGGGGGGQATLGSAMSGGASGGAGACIDFQTPTSTFASPVTVTLGTVGSAGTGATGAGGNGGFGGNSLFGTYVTAGGGGGGGGGTSTGSGGGAAGGYGGTASSGAGVTAGGSQQSAGSQAGASAANGIASPYGTQNASGPGATASAQISGASANCASSSGTGGTLTAGSAATNGGGGGLTNGVVTGVPGGASASSATAGAGSTAQGNGSTFPSSTGAGGGGANTGGTGGAGGTGAATAYGCPGGGGGAGTVAGGAGGVGCHGYAVVETVGYTSGL